MSVDPRPDHGRRRERQPGHRARLLQRQILPVDRDTDVIRLYVDPDPAVLDADKYDVGSNKAAKELNAVAMRQNVGTRRRRPPRPASSPARRTALPCGEKISFGTYFNAFPASYWRRWTIVSDVRLTVATERRGRDRHRLPVDWPTAASQRVDSRDRRGVRRASSPSTCR